MYIKLVWSQNKQIRDVQRSVEECIYNSAITDTATAETASANWLASVKAGIDWDNSEIIRTVDPDQVETGVNSRNSSTSTSYNHWYNFMLRFKVFDDTDTKYLIQMETRDTVRNTYWKMGFGESLTTSIPRILIGQADQQRNGSNNINGTDNNVVFSNSASTTEQLYNTNTAVNIRAVHVYITNTCFIWHTTHQVSTPTGYGTTYGDSNFHVGPYIFSQYSRYDHFNKPSNGIVPVAFNNFRELGQGFRHTDFDKNNIWEGSGPTGGNVDHCGWRMMNIPSVYPRVGTSYPFVRWQRCNWGSGVLFNDFCDLNTGGLGTTSAANPYNSSFRPLVRNDSYYRYPSSDLTEIGFAMHPMQVRASAYGYAGGSMTDTSGFYLFNGDYQPGDEFTYNSKVYHIIPIWDGYTQRVGVAVPKE